MSAGSLESVEEHDGTIGLGVEVEDDDPDLVEIEHPWDPERIRVNTKAFSLRNVVDWMDEGRIELDPEFQRLRVWRPQQQSRLIESVILQIPLPAFYFAEDEDGDYQVVDGLQRLSTIRDFVRPTNDPLELRGLEYLDDLNGATYGDLPKRWRSRIDSTQLVIHIIDPSTPAPVKFNIFKRINTGGTPLNGQEIRHAMSRQRSRDFLARCASAEELHDATGGVLLHHRRMFDREIALRFVAFRLLGDLERYSSEMGGSMENLLSWAIEQLDDPVKVSDSNLEILYDDWVRGLTNAFIIFDDYAFRKRYAVDDYQHRPVNRALLDSWATTLAEVDSDAIVEVWQDIALSAYDAIANDPDYERSITSSTGDPRRVEYRFRTAREILREAIA